jgi:glycosyltransferase involved in cell wall biosynthesis
MRTADRVVAISEFVKGDLVAQHGIHENRVVVIPNPIDWGRFEPSTSETTDSLDNYFIAVSAHYPHKNLATLLRAFRIYRLRGGQSQLILIGTLAAKLAGTTGADPLAFLQEEPEHLEGVQIVGHASDAELGRLYRNAGALFLPSLFEGFGMPAVEAIGMGIPVVCSKIPALEEATLGFANYCDDPTNPNVWADWMFAAQANQLRLPAAKEVGAVREVYSPQRIGLSYAELCL